MNTDPFPHVVMDDWFDRDLLEEIAAEIPDGEAPGWREYRNGNEFKNEGGPAMWGPAAIDYYAELNARVGELEELFDIPDMHIEMGGGGYHLIPPGGRLAMHADFNRSPSSGSYRRLNVLTYLNEDWTDPGGLLLLGMNGEVSIAPEMGRTVVFATSERSWHGHPVPASRWRKSIAAYFFTDDPPATYEHDQTTVWLED